MVVGSPGFIAPELLTVAGEPGPAVDVFALGALVVNAPEAPADQPDDATPVRGTHVGTAMGHSRGASRRRFPRRGGTAVTGDTVRAASGDIRTAHHPAPRPRLAPRTWSLPGIIDEPASDASGWSGRVGTSEVRAYNSVDG